MTVYTVIGYREDYYDGRYDDRSGSEMELSFCDTPEQAIEKMVEFRTRTERSANSRGYSDWEPTLLIDGRNSDAWFDEFGYGQSNEENPFPSLNSQYWTKFSEWKSKIKEREDAAKKEALEKKKREADAAARAAVAREKKLLKELREKYPDA